MYSCRREGSDHQKAYRNLCHIIGGQWVSGQTVIIETYYTYTYSFSRKKSSPISTQGAKCDQSI